MGETSNIRVVDIAAWDRKEQFHFFKNYENPFFGLVADVDVTELLKYTKAGGYSFFAAYLYISQLMVNKIPEFRYRLIDQELLDYPVISAGSTVMKKNGVFTFCYFDYMESFRAFEPHVLDQIEKCSDPDAKLLDHDHDKAQIHYSVIPWLKFTGLSHPRNYGVDDSIPKIVFGKYEDVEGKMTMPISVEAHHALMDGFHMGQYFEGFQVCANFPAKYLED